MRVAARLDDGDGAQEIDLDAATRRAIREEAAFRRISSGGLVAQLLEAIARGDQFGDVLRRGEIKA